MNVSQGASETGNVNISEMAKDIERSFDNIKELYDDISISWTGKAAEAAGKNFDNFVDMDIKEYLNAMDVVIKKNGEF